MKLVGPLVAAAGVIVLGSAILVGGARLADQEISVGFEQFEIDDADLETDAIPKALPAFPGRPVAPEIVAPFAPSTEPLQRAEPRRPLGDMALAVPPTPGAPKPTLLRRPVAVAAGRIEAEGHTVEIDGIDIVEPDETCASGAATWPCGMIARTAFRNWLRGRAVECTVSDRPAAAPVVSACRLGKQDVAGWLVENGHATARDGGPYVEAGGIAKSSRRGIFGPGPTRAP